LYVTGQYDLRLVALSILIAIVASYAALDLTARVTGIQRRVVRHIWLCCGSIALGIGIWAMHYVGMEAFHLPVPVAYDWPTVLLSLLAAIVASWVALFLASRSSMSWLRTSLGSLAMGCGIAAMHYIGMDAMRLAAVCIYSPALVTLSVALAISISFVALRLGFALRDQPAFWAWRKAGSAALVGLAISSMHYVGMASATFVPGPLATSQLAHAVDVTGLGLTCIAAFTLVILALALAASTINRQTSHTARALAKRRLQLDTVFDTMNEAVVVLDKGRDVVLINRAAAQLIGISQNQALDLERQTDTFELLMSDGMPLPVDEWPGALALRGVFRQNYEIVLRRKDTGKSVFMEMTTVPIASVSGNRGQVIVTMRDITERKKSDDVRALLAAIVESSDDAIIGEDLNGCITSWNNGAAKIFGYTASEMLGQSIRRLLPPGRDEEVDSILLRIKHGQTVDHVESVRRRKDGKLIQVSLMISPIRDAWGKVVGASKIVRDITEQKRIERQLLQSRKMDAIGQLTGGIAHDFNNLLAVVIGNLELLERLIPGNDAALKRLQTAQKAANRGADLTRTLLAFSRSDELRVAPLSPISLRHSIRNVLELATRAIGPEIKMTARFDQTIPTVFVDVAGLESALLNLALNARDAMPSGGSITIATHMVDVRDTFARDSDLQPGCYACVSVSDSGEGMPKEIMERAFEPFFTTKPRGRGTGLGLAMVYGFAKQSGGAARIYSEIGLGTTVSIYLPLAPDAVPAIPLANAKQVPARQGGTVLVVDDELDLLDVATVYLNDLGYEALQAQDGAAALELVERRSDIVLILTDIIMPGGMNGVELADKVHRLKPAIKIIYSSGFPAGALEERSMLLAEGPLLRKPYQFSEFRDTISGVMNSEA
jgi:PAS domain S-box-containing protein